MFSIKAKEFHGSLMKKSKFYSILIKFNHFNKNLNSLSLSNY